MQVLISKNKLILNSFFQMFILTLNISIINTLVPLISEEFNVGLDLIGFLFSLSIFVFFLVSLITGYLIDFFNLKNVLFIALILSFIGSIMLYFSNTYNLFIISYLIYGLGLGIDNICVTYIVGSYFYSEKASNLIRIYYGNALALVLAPLLVSLLLYLNLNWHYFFLISLFPQLSLITALFYLKIPNKIKISYSIKYLFVIKKIIFNPIFALSGIIIFFYAAVTNIFTAWFTTYFNSINVTVGLSSFFLSSFQFAFLLGMFLKSKIIKYFSIKKILFLGSISSFFLLILTLIIPNIVFKNIFIFLFGISLSGNFAFTFSIAADHFPDFINLISAIMFALANLGIMVFQYLSGYLSEYWSKNSVIYINIIILFILIFLTAAINSKKFFIKQITKQISVT